MARRKKAENDDMLAPFREAAREAAKRVAAGETTFDIAVKGALVVDVEAADTAPVTIGALLLQRIQNEMTATRLGVSNATKERRRRDLKQMTTGGATHERWVWGRKLVGSPGTRLAERYPGSYRPDPEGPYGHDSGYLFDALKLNVENAQGDSEVDVFVGIPKNRQKAAFILRRIAPSAAEELPAAVQETTIAYVRTVVRKTVRKLVRKELRAAGVKGVSLKLS